MEKLVKSTNARNEQPFDPIMVGDVVIKFKSITDGESREIRGEAELEKKNVGRISYVTSSGHFFMSVDMKILGAEVSRDVADALFEGYKQIIED